MEKHIRYNSIKISEENIMVDYIMEKMIKWSFKFIAYIPIPTTTIIAQTENIDHIKICTNITMA